MHPSAATPPPPQQPAAAAAAASPQSLLDLVNPLLSLLLLSSLTVRSFTGRWQALRSKLTSLHSSLSSLSSSPHWSDNPLLLTLLPDVLSTLQRLRSLHDHCSAPSFNGSKLHMQSDLDMASTSLSNHLHDLDLLLRSGVLHQSNAIVLSQPGPGSGKDDVQFFVKDLFTRLQIGGIEFKKKALESLLQLLADDEKAASLVAREGNVAYLIHLLDLNNNSSVREQALAAVSILASANDESRKSVFEGGGLGPLLRIIETGSSALKEKATIAVEAITADLENAWAISAYSGISVLVEACRSSSPATQSHAVGAIRNVACVADIKVALAEEGAVPVLVQLLSSSSTSAIEKSAGTIAILAESGEYFRTLILQERGLQKLMRLTQDLSSPDALESVFRAISSLLASDAVARILSSSTTFIVQIGELIKHGNIRLQQISASLLSNLSLSDGNKRAISSCMGSLLKLMESPKPVGLQDSATQALVALLTVRSNRKELVRDEKCLTRLVQMLDPENELVPKGLPVAVASAIVGTASQGCRKRLVAAGAHQHMQRLAEMQIAGARRASQRLAGNRLKTMFSRSWRE